MQAGALLLAGDEVRVGVAVDGPVTVEVVETAGTVAYDMRGGSARWDVDLVLSGGARVAWHGEPFVVSAGADVDRRTTASVAADSVLALRETLVFGRSGQTGGTLRTHTRISCGGVPVLAEDLDLSPDARAGWATLRGHRASTRSPPSAPGCRTAPAYSRPSPRRRWPGASATKCTGARCPGCGLPRGPLTLPRIRA